MYLIGAYILDDLGHVHAGTHLDPATLAATNLYIYTIAFSRLCITQTGFDICLFTFCLMHEPDQRGVLHLSGLLPHAWSGILLLIPRRHHYPLVLCPPSRLHSLLLVFSFLCGCSPPSCGSTRQRGAQTRPVRFELPRFVSCCCCEIVSFIVCIILSSANGGE
jgi:hypothetical protein